MAETITIADIEAAQQRVADVIVNTPCPPSPTLSELTGCEVFCKLEYLQRTGSFKERGAANALMQLPDENRCRGVIAASAGNHALALACLGKTLDIAATVVMPKHAPLIKAATCRRYGARVIHHGETFTEARQHADELAEREGLTYVHGYDDPAVIAGQGTLGLEVLDQVNDLDAIIVPIGGGGLIAGVAAAVKAKSSQVRVIGVEASRMANYSAALAADRPVSIPGQPTLADGLAVGCVGANAFATARSLIDEVVQVDESGIALAVLRLVELEKSVVEGAGATPLAALMSGQLDNLKGRRVVLPLCGGNIDPLTLHRVIEYGLGVDGRLHQLEVTASDRPGGLAKLTGVIAEAGASIQHLLHDRIFAGPDIASVQIRLILETRDCDHFNTVVESMKNQGYPVRRISNNHMPMDAIGT